MNDMYNERMFVWSHRWLNRIETKCSKDSSMGGYGYHFTSSNHCPRIHMTHLHASHGFPWSYRRIIALELTTLLFHSPRDLKEYKDQIYRNDKGYLPRHELWRSKTGTDASEGLDIGVEPRAAQESLHPTMVTGNDDDYACSWDSWWDRLTMSIKTCTIFII